MTKKYKTITKEITEPEEIKEWLKESYPHLSLGDVSLVADDIDAIEIQIEVETDTEEEK